MKRLLLSAVCFVSLLSIYGQGDDPILFTVEKTPVHVSEFKYIYSKTNGYKADYSRESLEEYLDLYVKFKLKVRRAKDMQLDTIAALQTELEGYRRQLADSYLINKEVTEKLVKEAYERSKEDVNISHIFVAVDPNAGPTDTLHAYKLLMSGKRRIEEGEAFSEVAKEISGDPSVQKNGGEMGYLNVLFPNGFYALENKAYSLPIGAVSEPVRSIRGYHLVKVNDRRPARAEIEAAHILVRFKGKSAAIAKEKIDSIYQALSAGADFASLAKQVSEDSRSASNGGRLGFFGINKYDKKFEDAAFGLENDGAISEPFQSSIGWHIVKRISRRGIQPYNDEKSRLEREIKNDRRFEKAKLAMLEDIKREGNFRENPEALDGLISSLDQSFLTFQWKPSSEMSEEVLFSLGKDFDRTVADFKDYLARASRRRMSLARSGNVEHVTTSLYEDYVSEECFKYEEALLEEKYPDFRSLMREYREGILLFEATKLLVWDKASQDTAGLKDFFKSIKGKYRWGERAKLSMYRLDAEQKEKAKSVMTYASKNPPKKVLAKYNAKEKILSVEEKLTEREKSMPLKQMEWKVGALSRLREDSRGGYLEFMKIEEVLPAEDKQLDEARGYIIADYQDYLEKRWVEQLRKDYKVKINKKVFESLINKDKK